MRDNSKRTSASADPAPSAVDPENNVLDFSTPTEIVDLPSKGKYYSETHPLYGQEAIEIKFMTAKDEDILTSPTLLKKGLAIDRFLQNVIINKRIKVNSLLSGDKNAILVASRINGFGEDYTTKIPCPACQSVTEHTFHLSEVEMYDGLDFEDHDIVPTDHGTFIIKTPRGGVNVEVRLLTGKEENELATKIQQSTKRQAHETNLTDQLKTIIVSVNGSEELQIISQFIAHLSAFDSRYLRAAYLKAVPDLNMKQEFLCSSCGFEKEVDIPLTVDFFWSRQ